MKSTIFFPTKSECKKKKIANKIFQLKIVQETINEPKNGDFALSEKGEKKFFKNSI